jgi:hypothetical protein
MPVAKGNVGAPWGKARENGAKCAKPLNLGAQWVVR